MPLKRSVDSLDGLDESLKGLYVEKDGKFYLDIEGEGDIDALKRAKDREAQAAKEAREAKTAAEAKVAELETQLADAQAAGKGKKPDELQRAYEAREADNKKKHEAEVLKLKDSIKNILIDGTAKRIASELFTVPELGEIAISKRLSVDFDEDKPTLRVLGADGQISVASIDDFKKELLESKSLAPILIGSKASGGGAAGAGKGNGGAGPKPYEMTSAERQEWFARDPVGFAAAEKRGEFKKPLQRNS